MKQLYFIRHGESEFNRSNRWTGSTDVRLTETGHEQARLAGVQMRDLGLNFDIIISSPLKRARQTAEHIAHSLSYPVDEIEILDDLVERDFGKLEGKKSLIAATRYLIDESAIDKHENVEKLSDLQTRVNSVLEYLQALPHDNILVVGHGAFGRALRRAVKNHPLHVRGKSFSNAEFERLI